MKLNTNQLIGLIANAILCVWLLPELTTYGQNQTNVPPGFASHEAYVQSLTNEADVEKAAHSGFLSEEELRSLAVAAENRHSIGIYGKVIDQDGNPMAGVDVTGSVSRIQGWFGEEKWEDHATHTDANGLFQFSGLTGADWNVSVKKDGYIIDYTRGCSGPSGGADGSQTNPNNRIILTMYKQHGAEPMTYREIESRVPYDGTTASFNLTADQKSTNGDLKITLLRSPLKIRRGLDKYDWNVKIEMTNGGLQTESSPYPYWAPESGYQSAFVTGMSSNNVAWNRELKQNFYIKDGQGKYGRLLIDLFTDAVRPDTGIKIQTWFNPSGSRNLEFDPAKQINQ